MERQFRPRIKIRLQFRISEWECQQANVNESILSTVSRRPRWIMETRLGRTSFFSLTNRSDCRARLSAYYTGPQTVGLIDAATRLASNEPLLPIHLLVLLPDNPASDRVLSPTC